MVSTWRIFATGSQVLTHWSCCWVESRWTIPCHSSRQCRWSWKAIHSKLANRQKIHSTELPASSHAQACLKVFAAESNIYYLVWSKHFINRQDEWIFSFRTWSRHIPAMNKTWKRIEAQTHRNKILESKVFHVRPSQRAALPSTCRNPRIWEEFKQGLLPWNININLSKSIKSVAHTDILANQFGHLCCHCSAGICVTKMTAILMPRGLLRSWQIHSMPSYLVYFGIIWHCIAMQWQHFEAFKSVFDYPRQPDSSDARAFQRCEGQWPRAVGSCFQRSIDVFSTRS